MSKIFNFIEMEKGLFVEETYLTLLSRHNFVHHLTDWENLEKFFTLTFSHKKGYREVKAFQIEGQEIYVKKYLRNLKEGKEEWKNISLLWEKGIPTSVPIFYFQKSSFILIGTKKIEGKPFIYYLEENSKLVPFLIKKIAEFMATFHIKGFIHQDCYLNHFYWDEIGEKLYLIDVGRVKYKSPLFFYYRLKDLSQLKFSFYKYFGKNGPSAWCEFLNHYEKNLPKPLNNLEKIIIHWKFIKIKKHTEKLEKFKLIDTL
ncbi:MAG: lipopolysaccharide kinase InaA family protein [Caldimicrobium sp.]